jgi:hypothetical protein
MLGALLDEAVAVCVFCIRVESHATSKSPNGARRHISSCMSECSGPSGGERLFIHSSVEETFDFDCSVGFDIQLFFAILGSDGIELR